MSEKTQVNLFDSEIEGHLGRYLRNREEQTCQEWEVVERYHTDGTRADWRSGGCSGGGWNRALIRATDGSTLRIYHYGSFWRMGQKVLAPRPQVLAPKA